MAYLGDIPLGTYIKDMKVGEEGYTTLSSFVVSDSDVCMLMKNGPVALCENEPQSFVVYLKRTGPGVGDFDVKVKDGYTVFPMRSDSLSKSVQGGMEYIVLDTPSDFSSFLIEEEAGTIPVESARKPSYESLTSLLQNSVEARDNSPNKEPFSRTKPHSPCLFPKTCEYRDMLREAIYTEDFEFAAQIRDYINHTNEPID